MANPTMDALARGGSVANQGMSVANSMMQGVQKAMDSTSDLTFKLTNLLKTEEARKFNQGMAITKSLQDQFQFNTQQAFKEEQLAAQERRWAADEALRGAGLQFKIDQAKITNPLVQQQIKNAKLNYDVTKSKFDTYKDIVSKGTSTTPAELPKLDVPTESSFNAKMDIKDDQFWAYSDALDKQFDEGKISEADYRNAQALLMKKDDLAPYEAAAEEGREYDQSVVNRSLVQRDNTINALNTEKTLATWSGAPFLKGGQLSTLEAQKATEAAESKYLFEQAHKAWNPNTGSATALKAVYDKASSAAKIDPVLTESFDAAGIDTAKRDKLIEDAVTELKKQGIKPTGDAIRTQAGNTLRNPTNLRKALDTQHKVQIDTAAILSPTTTPDKKFTQSNKVISSIAANPAYGTELTKFYNQMTPINKKRFDSTIYQAIIKGHTSNGNFNSHALMQNMPTDMFQNIMGMTKGEYGRLTSEINDGVVTPGVKTTKEALAEDIMPTVKKLARDSDSQSQLGQWTRDSEDDKTAKALVGDFTQKLMERYVKPSDIKTTMQLMDIKFQQDNQWFGGLGDNDLAENILQNENSLLNHQVSVPARELVGEGNKRLVPSKPINLKRLFISDDSMQGNAGRAHSGEIFARNIAAIMTSVGSDARLQNMLDKKNFVENHNTQKPFTIPVTDPTTNKDYVITVNLNDVYGILSAFYGSITDVNK